jgi:CRISPR-associated endonuclease/helicase Cas3
VDFAAFYQRLHGRDPFPSQVRLAGEVAAGCWPDVLTLPTSAGKTAVVDVWLWALAERLQGTPRRLYYLIDRRLLVDAAAEYASACVAASGQDVGVMRLRGGLGVGDEEWLLDPTRPFFISSTVDQLGSRLLGRAYGVGRFSAPLHAGLAGNDALIVVDEAHLVEPLRQTLDAVGRLRLRARQALPLPWHLLTMTATPFTNARSIGLEEDDRAHPILSRRLNARKLARLLRTEGDGVATLASEARRLRKGGAGVIGVIANTVDLARAVHERLAADAESILLIGRARPPDREGLARELYARAGTGTRAEGRPPLYVVATQTVEVGLDLDFDALVTELAPLSALRQRFGRLDRLGELGDTRASIVLRGEANLPYGKGSLQAAAKWLGEQLTSIKGEGKVIDFGIVALEALMGANPAPQEGSTRAPLLLPEDVELLFDPAVDWDITPYLHGERRSQDVQVAWRATLDELGEEDWAEAVEDLPPASLETLSVPLYAARAWLSGQDAHVGDLDAGQQPDEQTEQPGQTSTFVIWDGEAAQFGMDPRLLRPGMTLVVPSSRGGCDRYGWHPASRAPVPDLYASGRLKPMRWSGSSIRTRRAVELHEHLKGVGEKAMTFARGCGLDDALAHQVAEAGRLHDVGKNDDRFQLLLGAPVGTLLAKSGAHEARVSRTLSGLPAGWRHEIASLAARPELEPLVRYLVGTHHGRGRPWLPSSPDIDLWRAAKGAEWPGLVYRMRAEFGHWGLAYLEALVRLADWTRSAEEQAEHTSVTGEVVA